MAGTNRLNEMSSKADSDARDRHLLQRIGEQRDRVALAALYRIYFNPLRRFIHRMTQDLELAQEGVNDVMLVVWQKAETFSARSRVSTWIMGIAYRKSLKLAQRAERWSFRFKAADWTESVEPVTRSEEPTEDLILKDLLSEALKSLSPKLRAVVELTYVHGYSYEEIAEIVDCPANTVKTRMFHARARLREVLPAIARDEIAK